MRTLVLASGVALVAKPASERSTLLVEQRPGKRDEPWRAVPNGDVDRHAEEWAMAHGVALPRCEEQAVCWIPLWGYACKKHAERNLLLGMVCPEPHQCEWGCDEKERTTLMSQEAKGEDQS